MNLEISLLNPYFPWEEESFEGINFFFKGNLFYKNELLTLKELSGLICGKNKFQELQPILKDLSGEFAAVIESPSEVICLVDRIRSIPLFYSLKDDQLIISDNAYYLKSKIKPQFKEENAIEFLITGYVTGNEILFHDIFQIQAGEVVIFTKKDCQINTSHYHQYLHKDYLNLSEENLLNELDDSFKVAFKQLVKSTVEKEKQLVVPLSGGLDSRIIVAMLKKLGVDNVICYSYGKKTDKEVKISQKVAESIGYKWYFIEYTKEKWEECFQCKEFSEFEKYAGNLAFLPCIQEFLAIRELKKKNILPINSVIVPGHAGDMLAGSHIPINYSHNSQNYNFEVLLHDVLKKHYILWKWYDSDLKSMFERKIKHCVENLVINDSDSCANALEFFDFKERQAKFIVNSVRNYELFGYEWRVPFWNSRLIDFFLRLPLKYRLDQELYKKYSVSRLFIGDLECLAKIECTTNISNQNKFISTLCFVNSILDYLVFKRWDIDLKNLGEKHMLKLHNMSKQRIDKYNKLQMIINSNPNLKVKNINSPLTLMYLVNIIGESSSVMEI